MSIRILSIVLLAAVSSCSKDGTVQAEAARSKLVNGVPAGVAVVLPASGSDASCDQFLPAPSLCDWACRYEAVFIAEVLAVEANVSPATSGKSDTEAETCANEILPAVSLRVAVLDTFRGSVPTELTVVVPRSTVDSWTPTPLLGSDGGLAWAGTPTTPPFEVGSLIGLRASPVDGDDRWSALDSSPFTFTEEWLPVFTSNGCVAKIELTSGTTYQSFKDTLPACPDSEYCQEARANWDSTTAAARLGGRCPVM